MTCSELVGSGPLLQMHDSILKDTILPAALTLVGMRYKFEATVVDHLRGTEYHVIALQWKHLWQFEWVLAERNQYVRCEADVINYSHIQAHTHAF